MRKIRLFSILFIWVAFSFSSQSKELIYNKSDLVKVARTFNTRPLRPVDLRFKKIGDKRKILKSFSENWSCVVDTKTGLMWERKLEYGKRWWNTRYTNTSNVPPFTKPTRARSNCIFEPGQGNPVIGKSCHTEGYVEYINSYKSHGLCGFNDWRLPSEEELRTILDINKRPPFFANRNLFPTQAYNLWTSTRLPNSPGSAIALNLTNQIRSSQQRNESPIAVLLVRGTRRNLPVIRRMPSKLQIN